MTTFHDFVDLDSRLPITIDCAAVAAIAPIGRSGGAQIFLRNSDVSFEVCGYQREISVIVQLRALGQNPDPKEPTDG